MAEIVGQMYACLAAPVAPVLFATDARGGDGVDSGGYGIVAADVGSEAVTECILSGMKPGFSITRLDAKFTGRRRPEEPWRRTIPRSRLPKTVKDVPISKWHNIEAGLWKYEDHITLGEARAVVRLVRVLGSCVGTHGHKVVTLQDNMATSGAFTKGRSAAPALNYLARQRAATSIGADMAALLPWIESSLQPADELSRLPLQPQAARPTTS